MSSTWHASTCWGAPVGDIVLKPVGAGRPGRLCDAVLAACKAAAVRVVIARALKATVDVIRPHSRSADEVDVDNPGEECNAQALHSHCGRPAPQKGTGQAKGPGYWHIAEVAVLREDIAMGPCLLSRLCCSGGMGADNQQG